VHVAPWLERAAAARPDHPAIETAGATVSYAQLLDRARRAAGALADRGVGRGDRVGLDLPPGLDVAVALHGCLLLGAAAVPVDARFGPAERAHVTRDCRVVVDEPLDGRPVEGAAHDLDATAIVVHTSGTTGDPKPVELTYGNWLWSALGSAAALGHPPDERWVCALPLSHVGGLSILLRSAIAATTVLLHERWSTEEVLADVQERGATLVSVVPTTLRRLLDAGLERPPSLRWALLGGAPLPPSLVARAEAAGVPVAPTYGLTEACSQVTTLGAPLFCTRVELGADGEILVSGPTAAPGATAADGRLHTGDLGALDADGLLTITGRKADTIVTGGENVAPAEVEAVLEAHPAVAEAAVLGRDDQEWGEAVVAMVVLRPGAGASAEELRAHAAASLAPYKVPKVIALRDRPLPRTPSGKLLRRHLED
jgi:O-succinylbenzoic acid--CoA ligase